jgi:hypothetical protein
VLFVLSPYRKRRVFSTIRPKFPDVVSDLFVFDGSYVDDIFLSGPSRTLMAKHVLSSKTVSGEVLGEDRVSEVEMSGALLQAITRTQQPAVQVDLDCRS